MRSKTIVNEHLDILSDYLTNPHGECACLVPNGDSIHSARGAAKFGPCV